MAYPLKTTDGAQLLQEVVKAATGGKTFKQATRAISEHERDSLSRVIGQDVDQWRADFAQQLRATGTELLADLRRRKDELKAGEIAYSLAVVADKAAAIEGRNQVNSASVNIQVNNYGTASKDDLIAMLTGPRTAISNAINVVQMADEGSLQPPPTLIAVDQTQPEQPRERSA